MLFLQNSMINMDKTLSLSAVSSETGGKKSFLLLQDNTKNQSTTYSYRQIILSEANHDH